MSAPHAENVIYKSVEAVTALLRQTLDVVRHVAAKSALADVLLSVDSTTPAGAEQAVQLMREAFAATGPGAVERVEFIEDLVFFCQQQDAQDAELLKGACAGLCCARRCSPVLWVLRTIASAPALSLCEKRRSHSRRRSSGDACS